LTASSGALGGNSIKSPPIDPCDRARRLKSGENKYEAALTYYIVEGVLVGYVPDESQGKRLVHITALSGGGGGRSSSKKGSATKLDPHLVNNPYATPVKTKTKGTHRHGGPVPPGRYKIKPNNPQNPRNQKPWVHTHLGASAYLEPAPGNVMYDRGGFYIHGPGPHGSDGCIVPPNRNEFNTLLKGLKLAGGASLHVLETMGDSAFA
jgi:hypothetical protein